MRKRTLATTFTTAIVALLVLSACGPKAADFSAGFKSKDPTTFVIQEIAGGPDTLDPTLAYDTASGEILQNVYDTLVTYKRDVKTELVPMLATEVPTKENGGVSADGLTVTFKLRKGVKFHSGSEMTADDVAFSFQRGVLSAGSISPQWLFIEPLMGSTVWNDIVDQLDPDESKGLIDNREALKAEDPAALAGLCETVKSKIVADNAANTVTFHLAQPWGPFVITFAGFWGSIQEQDWVAANGGWDGDCGTWQNYYAPTSEEVNQKQLGKGANGTGPYKLKEWGDTEVILESNEDYWVSKPLWEGAPTGAPKLKTVIIKFVEEFSTRFAAMLAGDADMIQAGSAQDWPVMDEEVGATCDQAGVCTIDDAAKPLVRYVNQDVSNRTDAFFNFKINTEGGNDFIGSGKIDGNGVPPDFFSDIHIRKAFNYCFDWDIYIRDVAQGEGVQANNVMLLGELGDDPDGDHYTYDPAMCEAEFKASTWKSEDGKSLWDTGFRLIVGYNAGNTSRQAVAQIFRDNISAVNPKFKVESQSLEWPNYLEAYQTKKLPFFIIGWIEDIPDPHNWTFTYTAGAFGGKQGLPQELLDQFRPLVEQGATETDPAKRTAIYKDFNKLYFENAPAVILAQTGARRYMQRWVNGYYTNSLYSYNYYYVLWKS
ncbi:MAG: ABC transporter substrate-binding protein [Anaerolineales bacterium]|nr:ABC transporter substrate-binding protein [Anaerolineales bacterium]